MKTALKYLSALVFIAAVGVWVLHGARIGWTTTENAIPKVDEITGIEYTEYEKGLNFGIELPIAGTVMAVLLLASSAFLKTTKPDPSGASS